MAWLLKWSTSSSLAETVSTFASGAWRKGLGQMRSRKSSYDPLGQLCTSGLSKLALWLLRGSKPDAESRVSFEVGGNSGPVPQMSN